MIILQTPHQETSLEMWAHVGQIVGGFSFLMTAITAVITLIVVNGKREDAVWLDKFRNLYGEFWNDRHMQDARMYLINKDSYSNLKTILDKRNKVADCDLTEQEYKIIDDIDNFLSVMVRVRSFAVSTSMTASQKEIWGDLLFSFWIAKVKSRVELNTYVEKHWSNLLQDVKISDRKWYKINI